MASKLAAISILLANFSALADGGPGHSHAQEEGAANMPALGILIIGNCWCNFLFPVAT